MILNSAKKETSELDGILAGLSKNFELQFENMNVDGHEFEILNITNMAAHLDKLLAAKKIDNPLHDLPLWAKIWPSAMVLGRFLRKMEPRGKSLLELGAGMGVCSLLASAYGFSRIVLSDANSEALQFARANTLKNGLQDRIQVTQLEIGSGSKALQNETFDLIAASELLYLDELHRPILKFIDKHLAPGGKALFCTDIARLKPAFKKLASRDFTIQEGHIGLKSSENSENGPEEQRRIYNILILEKK